MEGLGEIICAFSLGSDDSEMCLINFSCLKELSLR